MKKSDIQKRWRISQGITKKPHLTAEEIREIRRLRSLGDPLSDIAERFGRSVEAIRRHCIDIDTDCRIP